MSDHTTPADELAAAVRRLRSGMLIVRVDLDTPLAALLEQEARRMRCASSPEGQEVVGRRALAVARAVLAHPTPDTSKEQP